MIKFNVVFREQNSYAGTVLHDYDLVLMQYNQYGDEIWSKQRPSNEIWSFVNVTHSTIYQKRYATQYAAIYDIYLGYLNGHFDKVELLSVDKSRFIDQPACYGYACSKGIFGRNSDVGNSKDAIWFVNIEGSVNFICDYSLDAWRLLYHKISEVQDPSDREFMIQCLIYAMYYEESIKFVRGNQ